MAEVFASPAKRRRMCADAVNEQEALADAGYSSSKAAASRMKGSKASMTPSKLKPKQGAEAEPRTPSSKKQLSTTAEDGLLNLSPQMLAPNLLVLNQLLGALYVTLPLVRSRGKPTTYHNMRVPVQNFCGRDFQVIHVQQIKALCPEALNWEHILAINPTTKRQEQQLCISMPTDPDNPKQPADTNTLQQRFFQRLQQQQACAGDKVSELQLPLAELPPLAGPSARDCTPSRQRTSSLLPATPQTAPPAAGAGTQHQLMTSPPPKRLATAVRPPAATALMSPPPARTSKGNRRLALGTSNADDAGGEGFTFSPAPRQPDLLLSPRGGAGPFSNTRGSLNTPVRPAAGNQEDPAAPAQAGQRTPAAALRPNRLFDTPLAAATPQQASAARPNTHDTPEAAAEGQARTGAAAAAAAAGVKVRKLTFDAAAPSAAAAAAGGGAASVGKKADKVSKGSSGSSSVARQEVSRTSGGIKFELGESTMALLKQVSSTEVKQATAARHQQLDQQRALDLLPSSFEVLRAIFGERGPCVKPQAEVVMLLRQKSTSKTGMSAADAAEQLDLMLRLVPDFLRLVTSSGTSLAAVSTAQSVRINRQLSWPAARQKLLAGAAEARSSGAAAAARAVAAEQQREAEEAAAAAAAVELDGDSEVSGSEEEEETPAAVVGAEQQGLLDVLAALDSNKTGSGAGSGSKAGARGSRREAAGSMADEALAMLGGVVSGGSSKADAVLGALAVKAPRRQGAKRA